MDVKWKFYIYNYLLIKIQHKWIEILNIHYCYDKICFIHTTWFEVLPHILYSSYEIWIYDIIVL